MSFEGYKGTEKKEGIYIDGDLTKKELSLLKGDLNKYENFLDELNIVNKNKFLKFLNSDLANKNLELLGSKEKLKLAQIKLKELGFYNSTIDGNFGELTFIALISYQKSINEFGFITGIFDKFTQENLFGIKIKKLENKIFEKEKIKKLTQSELDNLIFSDNNKENENVNSEEIGFVNNFENIVKNNEILSKFTNQKKGIKLLKLIFMYSDVSLEKFTDLLLHATKTFDVDIDAFVALIIGESDVQFNRDPFKVNGKGLCQITGGTWKDLYKEYFYEKDELTGKLKEGGRKEGGVRQSFKDRKLFKYVEIMDDLNINNLNQRLDPFTNIMASCTYLKYIEVVKKLDGNFFAANAFYNVGIGGLTQRFIDENPAVIAKYHEIFKKPKSNNVKDYNYKKMLKASEEYYKESIKQKNT